MNNFLPLKLEEGGQAALVDSLFFIAIVSIICTGLFYFAINYGLGPEALLNSFYSSDFAMDSLKVITYVNIMRDGGPINLEGGPPVNGLNEYDYLLALIKEDYSQNKSIGVESKTAISNTLYSVLRPFDDSMDYVFYISKQGPVVSESKFLALIIATHECTFNCDSNFVQERGMPGRSVSRVFYSCEPLINNVLEKRIFPNVGKVDSSYGKISLDTAPYIMGLHTWVAKNVKALKNLGDSANNPDLNCSLILTKGLAEPVP